MKNKIFLALKKSWILVIVLTLGLFLRLYNGSQLFGYNHDQDLAGWIIKDIVVNHHARLIGQLTSTPGVFIGPLFYLLLIPFYLIAHMDPIGGIYLTAVIGVATIWSCYYFFSKIFNEKTGLIAAIVYAFSPYTVFNDREVVPTMPLMIWSVWFFYANFLILKGEQKKGFILGAILTALIWHINAGLAVLLPIYFVSFLVSKKKIDFRAFFVSLAALVILSAPLILFETRHGFSETKAIVYSLTRSQGDALKGVAKFGKILDVIIKNVADLLWGYPAGIPRPLALLIVSASSVFIFLKGKIKKDLLYLMLLWIGLTAGFFAFYTKPVSEYYLNSLTIVWVVFIALIISNLLESKKLKYFGYLILAAFIIFSFYRFFTHSDNHQGYIERKAVVSYINSDAALHNYPCIAVSYITGPGYNLGYRWFFYLDGVSTRAVSTNAPVYSIVFPLSMVNKVDKTFGSLGVINPDYSRYNVKGIAKSCQGENANLKDSMFGYTE